MQSKWRWGRVWIMGCSLIRMGLAEKVTFEPRLGRGKGVKLQTRKRG